MMVSGTAQVTIVASMAPTARPYLKPLEAPLLGHRLRAFDQGMHGRMRKHTVTERDYVDSLFRPDADNRNVDGIDKLRGSAIRVDERVARPRMPGSTPRMFIDFPLSALSIWMRVSRRRALSGAR